MAYIRIKNDPLSPKAPIDPKPVAKHFDIVLGLDFHMLKVPWPFTPCPITPFAALIFDPMDYIHITIPAIPVYSEGGGFSLARNVPTGGTVYFNGMHKGVAQGALWGLPSVPPFLGKLKGLGKVVNKINLLHSVLPHPLFLLPKFFHPHEGQLSHGSKTVISQGMYQSTWLCRAYSCQDVGKILMNNPTGGFYLNFLTAVMVVLPIGKPVMIGGMKEEQQLKLSDLMNALFLMGLMHGLKFSLKMLGKLLTRILGKLEARFPRFAKFRAAVQPFICKYLGEPVDAASGHMASYLEGFSLPGPIPFTWDANYYSDSKYDGPLGKNIYHSYDITLLVSEEDEAVVMNDTAGRPVVFPILKPGTSFYNPKEKYELHCTTAGEYYVSSKNGLQYHFYRVGYRDNGHARLRSITDRNGFSIRFYYNQEGQLEKMTDSAHRDIFVKYNDQNLIASIQAPHPELGDRGILVEMMRYTYDDKGNLKEMYNAEGYYNTFSWEGRHIIARRFNNDTTFTFSYDRHGRCTAALGPAGLFSYTFEYFEDYTVATNSLGYKKTYYHAGGIVNSITNSDGGARLFVYDAADNLVSETNELGIATTYDYDDKSNLTGLHLPGRGTLAITYNHLQQPLTITQPNGGVWEYAYDAAGNLLQRINPLGAVTQFEYQQGQVDRIINPLGAVTRLQYNTQNLLSNILLPAGAAVRYTYDQLGRVTDITDSDGAALQREYNLLGNPVLVKGSSGNTIKLQYDSMGNAIVVSDKHQEVNLRYNFFGDIIQREQGGAVIQMTYDTEGQLRRIINEHREAYSFELDGEGNVLTETGFDGLTRRYLRNAAGQAVRITLPDGSEQACEYTPAGCVATVYYEKDGSAETFGYNVMAQLISAQNDHATVQLKRNLLGWIEQEQCNGHTLNSQYNQLGQRTALQSSLGAQLNLHYDPVMSWLEKMEANGWSTQFKYNSRGQISERTMTGQVVQQNQYDLIGRLTEQITGKGNKRLQRHYSWDGDRLTGIQDSTTGTRQFKHDVYGNLSEVIYGDGSVEYRMPDAVGNLFETPQQTDRRYDKGGRLLKSKNATYQYDQLGNLIRKEERNGRVWKYQWNPAGMLESVLRPDGETVGFKYDALGRRIEKRYKHTITKWVWDGNKPLHEWKEFDAKDSSADDLITWVFDRYNFAPAAKIKGTRKYSIVTDHLGTPIQGYDETGSLIWQREIDSYGNTRMLHGEAGFCNYLYQGQTSDPETGLAYNRFRYYNPEDGLYISQDPIQLLGGLSFYAYVFDPNSWIDPLGLARRGNCATQKHMDDVRDQFMNDNPNATHVAGGRDKLNNNVDLPETYLPPNTQLASSRAGSSFTDMTFDVNGQTVYVQTVDKGSVHGMSQREWDNANRITRQNPDAVVVTVVKGNPLNPGDLDVSNMNPGSIYRF
ncbi:RHS repeat-associated core domain-containing protein [Chitinophaga sp. HK235]|uniref:RHS repeat-associated core domain-containing protein n=1 Tax=Chitinophaga sp. HK235 TaxID=2952571 RepID=UPI001BA888DA|nr:RHS repeat-associated core domain-containing protein [Chitinophaga sp. HK235]